MTEHPRIPRVPNGTMRDLANHPHRDEASLILDYYGPHRPRRPMWAYHHPRGEVWRAASTEEILIAVADTLDSVMVAEPPAVAILTSDAQRRVLAQARQPPPEDLAARLAGKLTATDLRALFGERTP